jgi:hypothetical protein
MTKKKMTDENGHEKWGVIPLATEQPELFKKELYILYSYSVLRTGPLGGYLETANSFSQMVSNITLRSITDSNGYILLSSCFHF